MRTCFFVSDLHGKITRYETLLERIAEERPFAVFLGGDLLPHKLRSLKWGDTLINDFTSQYLLPQFNKLKDTLGSQYPHVFLILGNDDARSEEHYFLLADQQDLWHYSHLTKTGLEDYTVYGYSYVPPTPFNLKDWERYDVSRYVDPGCVHPTEGFYTAKPDEDIEYATIRKHLENLTASDDMAKAIFLFHSPPFRTDLDRLNTDGMMVDHVPLEKHVGSIAIKEFIEERQPYLTLHGHIHESSQITGEWKQKLGRTLMMNAAWGGPELSLIRFDMANPDKCERLLL